MGGAQGLGFGGQHQIKRLNTGAAGALAEIVQHRHQIDLAVMAKDMQIHCILVCQGGRIETHNPGALFQ